MPNNSTLATAPDLPRWYVKPLNRALKRAGARITSANRRLNLHDACAHLRSRGINPKTIIDVGVAWGTEDVYSAFPEAELLLVEANPQWKASMDEILRARRGHAATVAAGAETSTMTFHVWQGAEGSSSLYAESVPADQRDNTITVPVRRLDDLCSEHRCSPPYVVKIDVQGAEAQVIQGMDRILPDTEAVIVETSLFGAPATPEVAEIISLMHNRGFRLYDLVGFIYRPRDRALACVDAVFVPNQGKARDSHAWV